MPGFSYKPESETRYSLLQCNIYIASCWRPAPHLLAKG